MDRKTILIVEDEPLIAESMSRTVEESGYEAVVAFEGESGWRKYKETKPDLVLTDIRMPGISGLDLLQMIRAADPRTPVVIVSAYCDLQTRLTAFRLGANDFLEKPWFPENLALTIQQWTSLTGPEQEIARLENLVTAITTENEQLKLVTKNRSEREKEVASRNEAIWGAAAHNLKSEFLHIGHSVKGVRELADHLPEVQEECDLIERAVEYSELLLRRLLDYIQVGRPKVESISVSELMFRMESLVKPRLPSTVQLETTADASIKERRTEADIEQLMGVLLELISNAANVLRERGGAIELIFEEVDGELVISVKDNGPGIPKELRDKLLNEQVSSKSGLGLGLFLSNKVITALGGKLMLRSSSEKGTIFTILLPIVTDRNAL